MGYSRVIGLVGLVLIHLIFDVVGITYRRHSEDHVRISRAQGIDPPITDWEIGLREATYQALLRDGHTDPGLHDYLQNAAFSGKQAVRVFGDVAILARGQLYANPGGFNFVQDPYHNDCDDCYNEKRKCRSTDCDHYSPRSPEQLLALWTVKRIRHRDDNYGHRYEIEYTISPVDKALSSGFVTQNGRFDYGIPGHVFVIRSNPRYTNGYQHNKFFSSPDQVKWHRNYIPKTPVEQYPNVIFTQSSHVHHTPRTDVEQEATPSTTDPKEIHLYKKLINSLAAKTSTAGHRFKIATQSTSPQTIEVITAPAPPTKTSHQITPPQRTTLVQLPTGEIVPLTEITTSTVPEGQLQLLTPIQLGPFQTLPTNGFHLVPTQPFASTDGRQFTYTDGVIPHQIPSTQVPIFIMQELVPSPSPPIVRPEVVKNMGSTQLPKKTTIHFFAAEDDGKSTPEEKGFDDIFGHTTRKEYTKEASRKTNKVTDEEDDNFDLFPAPKPTESMKKVSEVPFKETSPFINQVPRPYENTGTTQPYPSTRVSEAESTFGRRTTSPLPHTTTYRVPTTYGTQSTRVTLPIPSYTDRQTTTTYTTRTPVYFRKTTTKQHDSTSGVPTTTIGTTAQNYNIISTAEPRETIITVTPEHTAPSARSNFDEPTISTSGYTQGRYSTISDNEHTTQSRESQLDNSLTRTTFIYPSTGIISTTYPPRSFTTNTAESSIERKLSTTQAYTTNTESLPTTERRFTTPTIATTLADYNREITQSYSIAFPSTETLPAEFTIFTTNKASTPFKSTTPTRVATTKLKPNKNNNDFLVEDTSEEEKSEPASRNKSKSQDYTDDDIFGPVVQSKTKKTKYKQYKAKNYRTDFTTEPTRTVAKTPKIIYSDFFEASTIPPTTSLTQFHAESQNNFITRPLDATTLRLPLTSQSYLTSISYQVNKKNATTPSMDEIEILPTIQAKLRSLVSNEKLQVFKAELPDTEETNFKVTDKEAFDNIALQLVNHARSVDLLNKKQKEEKKNSIEERKTPKYKRRKLFAPKYRRNQNDIKRLVRSD